MSTITKEQAKAIEDYVFSHDIPQGIGSEESACSIAAINLALTGELTDSVPACMSPVIGKWIIRVQDAMPDEMRNSKEWKRLLPLAAGTGREKEKERLAIILDWMWAVVLPVVQPLADERGFGGEWATMLTEKTSDSARAAKRAAYAAAAADADAAADAAYAAAAAAYAAYAAAAAAAADAYAAAAAAAAYAAAAAAAYAAADYADAARRQAWATFDPAGLLAKLVEA